MPINSTHSSAGVYTARKDLSVGAFSPSTAVVGMAGMARKGKINTPVPIRSKDDLKNIFGLKDPKYGFGLYVAHPISKQTNELYYVRLVNGAKYAVIALTVDDPTESIPQYRLTNYVDDNGDIVGITDPNELGFLATDALNDNLVGYFLLENPGQWNNEVAIRIRSNVPLGLDAYSNRSAYNDKLFKLDVYFNYAEGSAPAETYVLCLNQYQDDLNRQYEIVYALENESETIRFKKNPYFIRNHDPAFYVSDFGYFQGASDGQAATTDQLAKAYLDHYSDPEELRVTLLVSPGIDNHVIHRAMQQAASQHINCHAIMYAPKDSQTVNRYIRYRKQTLNLNTPNASLYSPDCRVFDEDTGRYLEFSGAGQVAAVYCFTDNNRGTWFAPAGIQASSVLDIIGLTQKYDQDDRDALTREQLCYIRKLPVQIGGGFAVWEASTLLNAPSAFQQIQIQRMVGYVLEQAHSLCMTGLFDPNDAVLREHLKGGTEDFLEEIKLARGLRGGESGSDGYAVVCDETNNTPQTIQNGDLILDIVLDPTRTTKRIIYRFTLNPKGSRSATLA